MNSGTKTRVAERLFFDIDLSFTGDDLTTVCAWDEHHARAAAAFGMGEDEYKQAMRALVTAPTKGAMTGKTAMFDTLTPTYLADLWLRGLLSRACLDDMSEAELVSMRTRVKTRTFEVRLVNDATGQHAAQRLDELTAYMRRRFPRRGSTPPCEAVCV